MDHEKSATLSRRMFGAVAFSGIAAGAAIAQDIPQNTSTAPAGPPHGPRPSVGPFEGKIEFSRKEAAGKVHPFAMTDVRLTSGACRDAQEANRSVLDRLPADRLIHNFRVNAGLPSSAVPLGGWEAPDCELRGHFTGHFLSACALLHASTGDTDVKAKGDEMVADLAKCQQKLAGGYLSAFPTEYFDRLNARKKVWAPYYTMHKIMAGMLDMHQHCGNKQALEVLEGMAQWVDKWSAPIPEEHMQDILNTEYGGMNDILYKLAAATGDDHYAAVGDRFTKKRFFNPLGLRRDELRGLHVNTHIPQVIGAARRYELSGDERFHDVADFFWYEVTSARAYVTGGTSNGEGWRTEPRRLAAELKLDAATTECCCAYNMLKLTRHLYEWTADPRYFDYFERTLLNHRLGTIRHDTGATMYYLSIVPGAWKTFNTEYDSFWCCTGTGVEEYAKLNDSIYFHDNEGIYVNLFTPSEVNWAAKGFSLRQETAFPNAPSTTLTVKTAKPVQMSVHLRVPYWLTSGGAVRINGKRLEAFAGPGSYLTIARTWNNGDRIEMDLPMQLHVESMPDDAQLQALLYGPLVLAGQLGTEGLSKEDITGPLGPDLEHHPLNVPDFHAPAGDFTRCVQPAKGNQLAFETTGQNRNVTLAPLNKVFDQRYSIYWRVS
ncbi:MAG: beta-L-arabinofuranosidase domain-containing protein [Bryobacteraceae bacterium]|jgi:hypothetical protein